jgi:hypothetical protein
MGRGRAEESLAASRRALELGQFDLAPQKSDIALIELALK